MGDREAGLDPYVPRIASEWDLNSPDSLWRSVDGTLVFVDISGFTNLSERLARRGRIGAEELTGVLNRVFGNMLEIVYARGGSLLKFGGDALLLLFATADHVMQASAATLEMRTALREASKEKTSVGRIDLKMSSGIHTGSVDFFLVGKSHRELIVTGPAASTTTEMEGTADAGEIVVSDKVKSLLPEGFTGDAKGNGWLLKKRVIHCETCGPVARQTDHGSDLAAFVPRQLRDHLGSGLAEAEHRIATVGFLKFKGVDAMLADEGPEAVGEALHEMATVVQDAADLEDVTFLASDIDADGGKVIFATGVPTSQHDDEGRVLRAARQILDQETRLSTQIGVNRGHVFAGDVGTTFRRTFTVMGDTVNLAARLMAAAEPGSLYASPGVLDESSTLFRTETLEPFHVKGKDEPVTAYSVFEETGVRPPETKHELPFHGREPELEMIVSVVTTCARVGRGGMMTISGDTGIGKSRLIAEVIERCPGLATLVVKAEPNGTDNPYWAFRDPMRRLLEIERSDAATMASDLREKVAAIDASLTSMVPLLGDVLHIEIADNETTGAIDPQFRPDRTADVMVELLAALHRQPFALVVEDGQWLDDASRNLVLRFGSAAESRPWTVVATMRDIDESDADVFGDGIALAPLDDESIRQIAIEVTAAAPLRPHELDSIVERAGGNPLFLSEILSVVRESGTAENIPDSLDAVVSVQIDSLPPLARQTLRYSSVLGTSFPTAVLQEYLALDDMELDDATRSVLSRFIEADGSNRLRFKHAVVHDVAYRGLPYRRRRDLHGRAGDVVERMSGDDPNASAEFLAYHFAEAGRHEKTWVYSQVAARKARDAFANNEAAIHYQRALDAARRIDVVERRSTVELWSGLGEVRDQAGEYELAREAFAKGIREAANDDLLAASLYLKRAEAWLGSGNYSQAKRNITLGQSRISGARHESRAGLEARLEAYRASLHASEGDFEVAREAAEHSIELAIASDEDEALARSYVVLDAANFMLGRSEDRLGLRAIEIYRRLGQLERCVNVMNNLGAYAYWDGNWNKAIEWYEQAVETAVRSGNVLEGALAKANIAEVLIGQGRYTEAKALLDEAERVFRSSKSERFDALLGLLRARCELGIGETELGVRHLEALAGSQRDGHQTPWTAETVLTLAEALATAGETEAAFSWLGSFHDLLGSQPATARVEALALPADEFELASAKLLESVESAVAQNALLDELRGNWALRDLQLTVGETPEASLLERISELETKLGVAS